MRIAQVAPLFESVPPKFYGGTERVVAYLTEALVELGHDVTLYASGDSRTRARLRAGCRKALRLDKNSREPMADHVYMAERVFQESDEFEFIHSHMDYTAFPLLRRSRVPHATTVHGRLDIPNLRRLYREFSDEPLVSISDYQRMPLPWAAWQGTVHHGLPANLYGVHEEPGDYLAFLGRVSPEKGVLDAIQIAEWTGMPLKIAAKVDKADQDYFEAEVKRHLNRSGVEFIGEIGEGEKKELLGNARALLFPIDWPEPFGLVMIEALACGTPVIARRRGSVPEILEHGKTGFIIESIEEAVLALEEVHRLSRKRCRAEFERRFTSARMAREYVGVYERLAQSRPERRDRFRLGVSRQPDRRAVMDGNGSTKIDTELSANERDYSGTGQILHPR